jgi:hypothetical protein
MNRIVRKEESEPAWGDRGRGRDRDGNGNPRGFRWPGANRETLEKISEGLKESAKSGTLLSALPFGASEEFRDQQKKSEDDLTLLEETYDLKLKEQLGNYLEGMRNKSSDLGSVGYVEGARDLSILAGSLEGDLPAFLKVLFRDSPLASLPWVPRKKAEEAEEAVDVGAGLDALEEDS